MHPSQAIRGRRSQLLSGRRIVLGVAGSIAAVEAPRIVRELIRHGAEVRVVMSSEAARLVTPESLHFASGHVPVTSLTGDVEHVSLLGPGERRADLLLVAPATANTISKIAHGIDDTPVTSCASVALGGNVPILLAPAMHAHMGRNPAVRANLAQLLKWGVGIIEPRAEEEEEKVASPEEVAAAVLHRLARGPWAGRRVVVIGGAGREPIDDVRSVTNESSGATATALASQAHFRGADVRLWLGSVTVPIPTFLPVTRWRSLTDLEGLQRKRRAELRGADAVWVPAALPDFTVQPRRGKLDSEAEGTLHLALTRATKLLPGIRKTVASPGVVIGFKLSTGKTTEQLAESGRRLLELYRLDWVIANDRRSMGGPETEVVLCPRHGREVWFRGSKTEVAGQLLDEVGRHLPIARPIGRARESSTRRRRPRR